ncbi:MAG: diphthine--ammonia ligase, partial [Lentisphaeria bacterium]
MKFVISYSGGKDSVLALHRMISAGNTPVALLVMCNSLANRSWFHGIDYQLLNKISKSLEIPLLCCYAESKE